MVNSRLINNAYVFLIITTLFSKVLYIAGQQRTADKTGHGNWYDKSKWSSSTKHQNSRISGVEGSGSEIDDMDDRASGLGPDDEDAQFGSGDDDEPIEGSGGSHEKYDEQFTYSSTMATWTPATSTRPTLGTTTTTTTTTATTTSNIMIAAKRKTQTTPTVEHRTPSTTPRIRLEVETRAPHIVPFDRTPATVATVSVGQTTVRHHASSTPMSDIYDTNTKRNDRNGFEWILSPGVLTAVIGGAVVGLLAAILLVMFIVYRMRKKDEGSYALEEPKSPPTYSYAYHKAPTREFYA